MHRDEFQVAFEATQVLKEPDRRIETFGSTEFDFFLISEFMDAPHQVRLRKGKVTAQRPTILKPDPIAEFEFEGFDDPQTARFAEMLRDMSERLTFLQYGFQFRKHGVTEETFQEPLESLCERIIRTEAYNPSSAVITGMDDAWEICLLKFTLDMVQKSHGINIFDLKRRNII
jgi:hypothetical protein